MFHGKIYIDVDDLMKLMGNYSRVYASRKHLKLRNEIQQGKKELSIGDYCKLTQSNYTEVYAFLRGELPPWVKELPFAWGGTP